MRARALRASLLSLLLTAPARTFGIAAGNADAGASLAYEHQTWRTENGLPQNSVHSIAQTADGYIWLATEGGLARFDGLKFVVFDSENTPELRNNNIRCLLEAKDGSLWIGTADGLIRRRNGRLSTFTTAQGLPSNNVLSMGEDAAGALRVITTEGAAVYQDGRFSGKPEAAAQGDHVSGPSAIDRLGRLWMATSEGLMVYDHGRGRRVKLQPWLSSSHVTALSEDRAGAIWVGTEAGAARIAGDTVYPILSPDSISHGLILAFFEDREGDMWVGTDSGGITVFRDQRFKRFGRDKGVPDDLVRCVFEDLNGTLWAGTNGHGLRRYDGKAFSSFTTADGLSSDVILSIAGDAQGNLLVGTPDGLNILRHDHVDWLTSADGLPDDFVRSIYKDTDGSLWIGTRRGLAHYVQGTVTNYTTREGLPSDLVGAMLRAKNGCLWVSTLKGLTCFAQGRFTRPAALEAMRAAAITSLFEDARGVLWIGTDTGGLTRLAGQHAFAFPVTLGLPKTVSGIVEDSNGQLWIASLRGLCRVSKAELDAYAEGKSETVSVAWYGTSDGLPVNEFSTGGHPTVWKDHRGTIWFASAKGIVSIDARHTAPNRVPPSIVIERVIADDRTLDPSQVSAFAPGLSRLSIEYAGLSFAAPQQIHFKYRMQGFDRTWVDAGTRRTAYYTNLPPGTYRFVVAARNGDGVWNTQGASLRFELRPHFYQTNWFRGFLLLAAAGLAYAVYRWRVNHVRRQFKAVIAERNRIAREIHDTLAQGFVGVSVQLELAQRLMSTSLDSAREVLRRAQELVQEGLFEARRSIWDLRSETGSDEDLPSKLSKAVRQSVQNRELDVTIEVTGAYRPLPEKIESEVVRIGREAVMNVVRHAKATRLDVSLAFDASKAQMTICDDGQGFVPSDCRDGADGHFGLRGMRERAEGIHAKLSVNTAAGRGTQVLLELPLK
jgi:ligand-binding sensor domain-containing protein/signal transduction histidine kinase